MGSIQAMIISIRQYNLFLFGKHIYLVIYLFIETETREQVKEEEEDEWEWVLKLYLVSKQQPHLDICNGSHNNDFLISRQWLWFSRWHFCIDDLLPILRRREVAVWGWRKFGVKIRLIKIRTGSFLYILIETAIGKWVNLNVNSEFYDILLRLEIIIL